MNTTCTECGGDFRSGDYQQHCSVACQLASYKAQLCALQRRASSAYADARHCYGLVTSLTDPALHAWYLQRARELQDRAARLHRTLVASL